jgi:hypothetical protein
MRVLLAAILVLAASEASPQTTLLGNCGSDITGIQLSTGNVYCVAPPPGACSPVDGLDYTKACDIVYHTGIFQ